MGATYLSMQLRTIDRDAVLAELRTVAATHVGANLRFYVAEPKDGWLPVFPNFTPELERVAKTMSRRIDCLVLLLLSADEDDLYCMFFRHGKQLPWFKIAAGRTRKGKEREKLATKLEALSEVCDADQREQLVAVLSDAAGVTFSSELLQAFCGIAGIRSAFSSFDYLQHGERTGLDPPCEPLLVHV